MRNPIASAESNTTKSLESDERITSNLNHMQGPESPSAGLTKFRLSACHPCRKDLCPKPTPRAEQ